MAIFRYRRETIMRHIALLIAPLIFTTAWAENRPYQYAGGMDKLAIADCEFEARGSGLHGQYFRDYVEGCLSDLGGMLVAPSTAVDLGVTGANQRWRHIQ